MSPHTLAEAIRRYSDPASCMQHTVELQWPGGTVSCPTCGSTDVGRVRSRDLFQCREDACRRQFSAKVGTLFEDSPLGLDKWFVAVWCVAAADDAVSSSELSRRLGITQKSAWYMLHRIRLAMKAQSFERTDEDEPTEPNAFDRLLRRLLRVPKAEVVREYDKWRARPKPIREAPWSLQAFAERCEAPDLVVEASKLLNRRSDTGTRQCVIVVGTGVNIQAATMAGGGAVDDWRALLDKVAANIGLSKKALRTLPTEPLSLWEAFLRAWGEERGVYPYQAERQLQNLVCDELRAQEEASSSFELYRTLVEARFADIISLNFDRRIGLCAKRRHRSVGAPERHPYGLFGESLYRHSVVRHLRAHTTTRIWYPHGDTKKAITIKLGTRRYGFYIGLIEELLEGHGTEWRFKPNEWQQMPRYGRPDADTWVDLFLERPLMFVGCGLSSEEWPLWWLLRKRSIQARRAPVYYLTFAAAMANGAEHFLLNPEMATVVFRSPNDLWEFFQKSLEAG